MEKQLPKVNYRMHIASSLAEAGEAAWNGLLAGDPRANPFLSYAFLHALHESGSACANTGWQPQYLLLYREKDHREGGTGDGECEGGERDDRGALQEGSAAWELAAALPLYVKSHSYGEYVFDWAWAEAYHRHGQAYYPKLLSSIPFTPVSGSRLLARDADARAALLAALMEQQKAEGLSSTHVLYPPEDQARLLEDAGFMLRSGVQFHWVNAGYRDFEHFLSTLEPKKRKNIRAERRKVREAGVTLRRLRGTEAQEADWAFFHRCYCHTYAAHHSTPYLNLDFFLRIGRSMPGNLLLVIAERAGRAIAASLVVHGGGTLFGRYWGELEYVPCLHFETSYYQPLEFCIEEGIGLFEGGAQGEHKMARGFMPTKTWSAHWLAHPDFADAVERFLERESGGIDHYISELNDRSPFK